LTPHHEEMVVDWWHIIRQQISPKDESLQQFMASIILLVTKRFMYVPTYLGLP